MLIQLGKEQPPIDISQSFNNLRRCAKEAAAKIILASIKVVFDFILLSLGEKYKIH